MLVSLEINRYNEIIALVKKTEGKTEGKIVERIEKFGYFAEDLCNAICSGFADFAFQDIYHPNPDLLLLKTLILWDMIYQNQEFFETVDQLQELGYFEMMRVYLPHDPGEKPFAKIHMQREQLPKIVNDCIPFLQQKMDVFFDRKR